MTKEILSAWSPNLLPYWEYTVLLGIKHLIVILNVFLPCLECLKRKS